MASIVDIAHFPNLAHASRKDQDPSAAAAVIKNVASGAAVVAAHTGKHFAGNIAEAGSLRVEGGDRPHAQPAEQRSAKAEETSGVAQLREH